jgi:hypothetical protein
LAFSVSNNNAALCLSPHKNTANLLSDIYHTFELDISVALDQVLEIQIETANVRIGSVNRDRSGQNHDWHREHHVARIRD